MVAAGPLTVSFYWSDNHIGMVASKRGVMENMGEIKGNIDAVLWCSNALRFLLCALLAVSFVMLTSGITG